jgi:hypothetical protein
LTKFATVNSTPYSDTDVSLTSGGVTITLAGNLTPAGTTVPAGSTYITIAAQTAAELIADTETVQVHYWATVGGAKIGATTVLEWTRADAIGSTPTAREKPATGLVAGRSYVYATYVKLADGTLEPVTGDGFDWVGNF